MTVLKPCPFCGSPAWLEACRGDASVRNGELFYWVAHRAPGCPMRGQDGEQAGMETGYFDTPEEAAEAWNRRGMSETDDDEDNEKFGAPEERIHIQIDWIKDSTEGEWEYAVWRGETMLAWDSDTLDRIPSEILKAIGKDAAMATETATQYDGTIQTGVLRALAGAADDLLAATEATSDSDLLAHLAVALSEIKKAMRLAIGD